MQVGTHFVHACLCTWIKEKLKKKGRTLDEQAKLPTPSLLGIDEFALRKGHHYDTILCDLEARDVIEVCAGRTKEDVMNLLKRLDNPNAVKAVSMDMSASFRPAVQAVLPQAHIVVDHFHVIQHVMKAFRKVLSSWARKREGVVLLHKKQYLFLKAKEDLTQGEMQAREKIGARLPLLEKAWQLKEALRTWYATATVENAATRLDAWIKQVQEEGPDALRDALSPFKNWRQEIGVPTFFPGVFPAKQKMKYLILEVLERKTGYFPASFGHQRGRNKRLATQNGGLTPIPRRFLTQRLSRNTFLSFYTSIAATLAGKTPGKNVGTPSMLRDFCHINGKIAKIHHYHQSVSRIIIAVGRTPLSGGRA